MSIISLSEFYNIYLDTTNNSQYILHIPQRLQNTILYYPQDMSCMFNSCLSLNNNAFVLGDNRFSYDKVQNMSYTYCNCYNLYGSPICGAGVVNMASTYFGCANLSGNPVCSNKTTSLSSTYSGCYGLTGTPVCGPEVISMYYTYLACYNLSGSPVCGDKVQDMRCTYKNCYKLTGNPVCGPNVTNMFNTYYNCPNLSGNLTMYSDLVTNTFNMLYNHNSQLRLNIFVRPSTTTNNALYNNKVGCGTWSTNTSNQCYYNATNNIYVYYNLT